MVEYIDTPLSQVKHGTVVICSTFNNFDQITPTKEIIEIALKKVKLIKNSRYKSVIPINRVINREVVVLGDLPLQVRFTIGTDYDLDSDPFNIIAIDVDSPMFDSLNEFINQNPAEYLAPAVLAVMAVIMEEVNAYVTTRSNKDVFWVQDSNYFSWEVYVDPLLNTYAGIYTDLNMKVVENR